MWSRKFSPTAGEACCTAMPCPCRISGLPMPDSSSSCGVATAPAHKMTSRAARASTSRPPLLVDDADAALAFEQHAARRRLGDDVQVGAPHGRLEIAMRHAHAPAAADAGLGLDDAFLVLAVVVRVELEAGGDGGLEQGVVQRVLVGHLGDAQRAAGAAPVAAALLVALDAREQRRHVLPAPAASAHLRPGVVVERLPAHPDEAVDGARAAQQLAARHGDRAIVGAGLRLGLVAPVGVGIVDQQAEADGKARVGMAGAPSLHQQHARAPVLGQPRRQRRAGRAGPDDDVVVLVHCVPIPIRPCLSRAIR